MDVLVDKTDIRTITRFGVLIGSECRGGVYPSNMAERGESGEVEVFTAAVRIFGIVCAPRRVW
jgi:hypothetical protein